MTTNRFGHIDLRVPDMKAALSFYAPFLTALGFTRDFSDPVWKVFAAEGALPACPWFAIVEEKDHRPNGNRIAFWAESREEVDALARLALDKGARSMSGPRACPDYSASYYAAFFEDPFGNRLEICYRTD